MCSLPIPNGACPLFLKVCLMPSPKNQEKSPNTKNPFELEIRADTPIKETFNDLESRLSENAIGTEKMDEMTSMRFKNQTLDPSGSNKTGEITVIKSNL